MRSFKLALLAPLMLVGIAPEAAAIDANKWRTLSEPEMRSYVIATVDAWINFHANIKKYSDPSKHSSSEAIFQATRDYVERRTDRREYNMAAVTWNAVSEMCKS
jgi:hypothetical protein